MGYFREENLEVTFDYGLATDIMSLVAKGTVSFGVSDGDQVIIARERGIPVKVVYTMYVKYPVGIVSLEEKGIKDIRTLSGKKVGTPGPYGSNYIGLQLLLRSAGMGLEDIELSYIGYTQVENILAGKVDAAVIFINNEPVLLRSMGKSVNIIEAYRVTPMVSAAVITGERLINERPDLVRRFVRAIRRASDYAMKNREQVLNVIRSFIPTLNEDNLEINRQVLFASMELWVDEDIKRHGLGYTSREDWAESIELMHAMGLIKRKVTPEECFTNEFLPEK
jgi:NitT/TauT family transport system substrate-binding protein